MNTRKKTLGLRGGKQFLQMEGGSSRIRFNSAENIAFLIKTNGDEMDLTSFIKLYRFSPHGDKREVIISSNGGILNAKQKKKTVPST